MQVPPIYCVKCRKRTPNRKLRWNRAGQVAANCSICGIKKLRFVSRGGAAHRNRRRRRHG